MFRETLAIALILPALSFAAGGGGSSAPKPSETTKSCVDGKVWDRNSKSCVSASNSALDDDTLYGAVREFAYAGQYDNAQAVLAAMSDQHDDRVLTYWGFTHRKKGDFETGMAFYRKAIAQNPDNILARSYMGQALVEQGDLVGARRQLKSIQASGGVGSWAETSLHQAISTGATYSY
ncbi:tetratricopeptide repeat protein [Roseovarius aestuarii]|uniref:Tetratricopeptide repeat protein n=1 Tax=Roseovarius aestuarii TaxID=475083 RepID=A0A1X7BNM2_9RHOB|nr:tetratricopeptide repeat protein [Roseovarius aestuarii]SMC11154.1 Tetratricopeptide repeat protein [Roseovarius aestuarii]